MSVAVAAELLTKLAVTVASSVSVRSHDLPTTAGQSCQPSKREPAAAVGMSTRSAEPESSHSQSSVQRKPDGLMTTAPLPSPAKRRSSVGRRAIVADERHRGRRRGSAESRTATTTPTTTASEVVRPRFATG